MAKKIYISKSYTYINQYLANFIIDNQLQFWDKINILDYKLIYLLSKTWLFFGL